MRSGPSQARVAAGVGATVAALLEGVYDDSFPHRSAPSTTYLRRKNARLARELDELRAENAALAREVAEHKAAADRLYYLAHHDALTALPNRVLLVDRLTQALAAARRSGTGVLVVYLDLDDFKKINDTRGHAAGDRVLYEVARRIAGCLRQSDTAGRVGGDEFVLVCPTGDSVGDAARIRGRLLDAIAAPIALGAGMLTIRASVGTSAYPHDGGDPAELMDRADEAMYAVKVVRGSR